MGIISTLKPRSNNVTCSESTKHTRVEWSNLTQSQKKVYLTAVQCLFSLPSQTGIDGTVTRYDDLNAMHQVQTKTIHRVGQFLPFHRLYVHAYEKILREECGYTGPTPWWDETKDAGNFSNSSIFDSKSGFGGDGVGSNKCVVDGPFANITLHIGPGTSNKDHCLSRFIDEGNSSLANTTYVSSCQSQSTYIDYLDKSALTTHGAGHGGVGGVMYDIDSSPGDPLFYLHHAWYDRLWWNWQKADLQNRLYQVGGYTTQTEPADGWKNLTLDYTLTTYNIVPNVTVREVMDIQGGYLCYDYDY
ncbi:hypothetical protein BDQ94DRAFT_164037 [Aspergillus welwitschiae]|uniref:Tyrosinase copper-binding domain-containing protein n=1 Tax=Aspergillus welwitschiae TaxID=1341132 RepID=A0A3F3PJR3_9EURO|nr:hypothetical protein BDQ94DRAFT_164037 [Aspergillus welwitschiae]RDH26962.1 hypothetical protein BDQ94DRAFT_164037 [Aspergillus welwitschiae]